MAQEFLVSTRHCIFLTPQAYWSISVGVLARNFVHLARPQACDERSSTAVRRAIIDWPPTPPGDKITTKNRDSMKRACTILLRAKKIKKFISMPYKGLHHFTKFFTPDFRMKHASL